MAHINSIGAALFSDLSVWNMPSTSPTSLADIANWDTENELKAFFTTESSNKNNPPASAQTEFLRIAEVREFPAMGTPPNIVKVPVFGQKTSSSIQGQADSPQLEVTINYIPTAWASTTILGSMVGADKQRVFRFTLLNSKPPAYTNALTAGIAGTTALPIENTQYYWVGKIEALLVKPALTDATTATLTLSIQSDFYGAYTVTATS
jgi:hypothetical protein